MAGRKGRSGGEHKGDQGGRPSKLTPELRARIITLYDGGYTLSAIARITQLTKGTLLRWKILPELEVRIEHDAWVKSLEGKRLVYLIEAVGIGKYKIGNSRRIWLRLGSLRNGSPVPLRVVAVAAGGEPQERFMHKLFRSKRTLGEWFSLTDADVASVRSIFDDPGRMMGEEELAA